MSFPTDLGARNVTGRGLGMKIPDKLMLMLELKAALPAYFNPKIKLNTICLGKMTASGDSVLSARAEVFNEDYEIICVYKINPAGERSAICITLRGPGGDMASYDYTIERGFHRHPITNGKKEKKHIPISGNLTEFAKEIELQINDDKRPEVFLRV